MMESFEGVETFSKVSTKNKSFHEKSAQIAQKNKKQHIILEKGVYFWNGIWYYIGW